MSYYLVVPVAEITQSMLLAANQAWGHMRRSTDGTLALLKYPDGPKPDVFQAYDALTWDDARAVLQTPEWT